MPSIKIRDRVSISVPQKKGSTKYYSAGQEKDLEADPGFTADKKADLVKSGHIKEVSASAVLTPSTSTTSGK